MSARTAPVLSARGIRLPGTASETTASTMTMWEPETAVRWVREAVLMASSRPAGRARSSPMAMPGTRARAWGLMAEQVRTRWARTLLAHAHTPPGRWGALARLTRRTPAFGASE